MRPADSASPYGSIHSVDVDSIYHRGDRRLSTRTQWSLKDGSAGAAHQLNSISATNGAS